ncbi:type II secretion system F family protein [Pasteurella testudinis]|uniref:type II secretion system F family protein n=1 Tax=Pasteurella testudinis TaxID=761 RepID=UPI004057F306
MKMAEFSWHAVNHLQRQQSGTILAENAEQAKVRLLARGLQQVKVRRNWRLSTKVRQAEIGELMQQLAMLLQAALPLKSGLEMLQHNCQNEKLQHWLQQLTQGIVGGYAFSQVLQQYPHFLTDRDRQLIKIGETSGRLAQICRQIGEDKAKKLELQRKLQKILLYPLMVLLISFGLTVLLLLFIVPQFAEMYQQNQQQLPLFTRFLLQQSQILQQYGGRLALLVALLIGGGVRIYRQHAGLRRKLSALLQRLPLFGRLQQFSLIVDSSRNLALMLHAGIPLNQALSTFLAPQQQEQPTLMQQEISQSLQLLQQGYAFSQSVSSRWFPQQAQQMLLVGEKSGCLGQMLQHIADNYQRRLDHQIDLLSQLLEPLLMLLIGALIGAVMLGMYLPIFDMGAMLG